MHYYLVLAFGKMYTWSSKILASFFQVSLIDLWTNYRPRAPAATTSSRPLHYTLLHKKLGAMNPDSKMLLEEIQQLFTEQNAKLDDANSDVNMERCDIYGMH
jgi:hypothetical protein